MPAKKTTGSLNIAILDSKIIADLCIGKFLIDLSPSTFIGTGADNVKGAKIQIKNPSQVIVKEYDVLYDIAPPMTGVFSFSIPTQAGGFQLGQYVVTVKIVDADNKSWEVEKIVTVCAPNPDNKRQKTGIIGAVLSGMCAEGKLKVAVNNPPTYNGTVSISQDRSFVLKYPTGSNMLPKDITVQSFSTFLFDGTYLMKGSVCATYPSVDNVSYKVKYILDVMKDIRCTIDECCIFNKLQELHLSLGESCSVEQREHLASVTLDVLRLLETAKLAAACGSDASDYVAQLEELLDCRCSVMNNEGTPLYAHNPAKEYVIEGCLVRKDVTGLTTTYTIDAFDYIVKLNENGGVLTASAPQIGEDCTKTFHLTFDINAAYLQIKNLAGANLIEAAAWANVVNKVLNNLNVAPLGITADYWKDLTFAQRMQEIINKINKCCNCDAVITSTAHQLEGDDVRISWAGDFYAVDVYLNNKYVDTVIMPLTQILLPDAADGQRNEFTLVPKCANGQAGNPVEGVFNHYGCPYVIPPIMDNYNVQNANCPFDLNTLYTNQNDALEIEYHTSNSKTPETLVPDPQAVGTGVYYAFHKSAVGCYSEGVKIQVNCMNAECSAPSNAGVAAVNGGFLIYFGSAVHPPVGNSYIVRRRLRNDPDVPASYTTIGVTGVGGIQWNASQNRWEILDTTAVNNTLYTYIIISDCGATQPKIEVEFSNYTSCPLVLGLTVAIN